tara:strand:+ start:578 stop:1387 length:810 start_codon:yes stop_codon:yes gene_type:complete
MKYFITLAILPFLFTSCISNNFRHAKKSLKGSWEVNEIFSDEKDRSGPSRNGRHRAIGNIGTFTISENDVTYNYTRLEKKISDKSTWKLTSEQVPMGFFVGTEYTLFLKDQTYKVRFGDSTHRSEINTRELTLELIPTTKDSPYHIIQLTKKNPNILIFKKNIRYLYTHTDVNVPGIKKYKQLEIGKLELIFKKPANDISHNDQLAWEKEMYGLLGEFSYETLSKRKFKNKMSGVINSYLRKKGIENTLSDIRIVRFSVNMTDYDPSNP